MNISELKYSTYFYLYKKCPINHFKLMDSMLRIRIQIYFMQRFIVLYTYIGNI